MIILPNHDKRRSLKPAFNCRLAAVFTVAFIALAMAAMPTLRSRLLPQQAASGSLRVSPAPASMCNTANARW